MPAAVQHRELDVSGVRIFVRLAGQPDRPALLLLHGFPSSSHSFRTVLGPLSEVAYLIAPDLPGFGYSDDLDPEQATFAAYADLMERLLEQTGVERFFIFLHDFGAAVGYQLALRRPQRIRGIIIQNGNAHESGLGAQWAETRDFWRQPTPENTRAATAHLTFEGTRYQYVGGVPDRVARQIPPDCWHLDWARMNTPARLSLQKSLIRDYANHVARFPAIQEFHRRRQPPALLLWGRHDSFFEPAEVWSYLDELDALEAHVFDGPHLLLETHAQECAALMKDFIRRETERSPEAT